MLPYIFRGKRKDNGEWAEGYYAEFHDRPVVPRENSCHIFEPREDAHFLGSSIGGFWRIVDRETVGQFIGINDKTGKKIFEGDVVKTKYGRLCIVEPFDSPNYLGWDLTPVNTIENCLHTRAPDSYDIWKPKHLEVVGNIYDNPEYLKGD